MVLMSPALKVTETSGIQGVTRESGVTHVSFSIKRTLTRLRRDHVNSLSDSLARVPRWPVHQVFGAQ